MSLLLINIAMLIQGNLCPVFRTKSYNKYSLPLFFEKKDKPVKVIVRELFTNKEEE